MIEELTIKGYRSLKDVTWRPGKLNVLIGPNAGGKSNLLRALALLRDVVRDSSEDVVLREGGLQSMMWDGKAKDLSFHLLCELSPFAGHEKADYQLTWQPTLLFDQLEIGRERLATYSSARQDAEILLDRDFEDHAPSPNEFSRAQRPPRELDRSKPLLGRRDTAKLEEWDLSTEIGAWAIHHDMPVDRNAEIRKAPVARQANRLNDSGENLVAVLHTLYAGNESFRTDIDDAMRAAFGDEYRELVVMPAPAEQRVQLHLRWKSLSRLQAAADLSDGTMRFLLLLAALATPYPPPLLAIDEPETGLHPRMLPIIAEYARQAANRCQVVLVTHSADLLDALSANPPVTTIVTTERGSTKLSNVDGTELRRWLKEFTLGSLFRSNELELLE